MFDEILKDIETEESNLNNELLKPEKEISFLEKVLLETNFQTILDILDINLCNLTIAYIASENKKLPLKYIKSIINNYRESINNHTYIEFFLASKKVQDLLESYTYEEINNVLEENSGNEILKEKINKMKSYDDESNIKGMIDLHHINLKSIKFCISIMCFSKSVSDDYIEYMEDTYEFKKTKFQIKDKELLNLFKKHLKNKYDINKFKKDMQQIFDSIHNNLEHKKSNQKKIKKELNNYKLIKNWILSSQNKKEITNIPIELSKIKNKEIAINILKEVNTHNQIYYEIINENYDNSQKNSYIMFKNLFKSYNINIDEYNINFNESIDIIKEKLFHLKNMNIKDKNKIINIINTAKLEDIIYINSLYSNRYLTTEFIENNNIFTTNLKLLKKNIQLLQQNNLSNTIIIKMNNTLIINNDILKKNISILKNYNLIKNLKTANNFSFLNDTNLDQKIDTIIELNLEKFLENDINILNKDIKLFNRILIIKKLNLEINNKKELNYFLDTDNFLVDDNKINEYIDDIALYIDVDNAENQIMEKNQFLTFLNEKDNKESKRAYMFNGIPISKNKVKRNLEKLESDFLTKNEQINCLISNLKLNQDNFNNLYSCLYKEEYQYKI